MNPSTPKSNRACPLCTRSAATVRFKRSGQSIVQCSFCQLLFVSPVQTTDSNPYSSYSSSLRSFSYLKAHTLQRYFAEFSPHLHMKKQPNTPVEALDIGCGQGDFLRLLQNHGWNATGIEANSELADQARSAGCSVCDHTDLCALVKDKKQYDLITLFYIAEKLPHLHDDFAQIADLLRPGAKLVLVTADANSFQRKIFGQFWSHFDSQERRQFFSLSTLQQLCFDTNLEVRWARACGHYIDGSFLLQRFISKPKLKKSLDSVVNQLPYFSNPWYIYPGSIMTIISAKR